MFDITKVKIGDYVENRDGDVGYVVDLKVKRINLTTREYDILPFKWCIANTKKYKIMTPEMENNPENYFKQIGTYVFDDKDKIKPLKYEDFAETREYGQTCMCRFFHDGITLSQERRGGKDIYKVITYQEMAKIDKINEIIKWINERG